MISTIGHWQNQDLNNFFDFQPNAFLNYSAASRLRWQLGNNVFASSILLIVMIQIYSLNSFNAKYFIFWFLFVCPFLDHTLWCSGKVLPILLSYSSPCRGLCCARDPIKTSILGNELSQSAYFLSNKCVKYSPAHVHKLQ